MNTEFRLVKVVPTGTGSYRIVIPKDMMPEIATVHHVGVSKVENGLLVSLVEIRIMKEVKK